MRNVRSGTLGNLVMKAGGNVLSCNADVLGRLTQKLVLKLLGLPDFEVTNPTKYVYTMGYMVIEYICAQPLDDCWKNLVAQAKRIFLYKLPEWSQNCSLLLSRNRGQSMVNYFTVDFDCLYYWSL
jgi:hypothetical protein